MEKREASKIYEEKEESMARLAKYASIINDVLTAYNRKSLDETMMIKTLRRSNIETTTRKTHTENVENIAACIAKSLDLNVPVVRLIAKHHDIGHTFSGHSGEWWLSGIKKNLGLGSYVHNSLGAKDLLYSYDTPEQIKRRVAYMYAGDENYKEEELEKLGDDLWIIFDGINSHNGELSEWEYTPNWGKNKEGFEQELLDCYVKEGADKKVVPGTMEACLMRLCDKISYIPYDMVDGLREGIIDHLDEEYQKCLIPILTEGGNLAKEEAEAFLKKSVVKENYQELAGKLQDIFSKDVIQNSTKEKIAMSPQMSKWMHKLRDLNNRKIVDYVMMKEDHEIYPKGLEALMHECSQIVMDEKLLKKLNGASENIELSEEMNEKYKDSPYLGFVKYILKTNQKDYAWTKNMLKKAREHAINTEIDEALEAARQNKKVNFVSGQEDRGRRIRFYEKVYKEQFSQMRARGYDIENLSENDYLKMKEFQLKNTAPRLYKNMEESLALEFGAKYLATLSDSEFMDLLKQTGKVTKSQVKSLTRKYPEIDLEEEYKTHKEWDSISEAQSLETEDEGR